MAVHDDTVPLRHMLEAAQTALELVRGKVGGLNGRNVEDAALCHAVQRVGFAAGHVSQGLRDVRPEIAWGDLSRRAEQLLARYDEVDVEDLRRYVAVELPRLVEALEKIIASLETRAQLPPPPRVSREQVRQRLGVSPRQVEAFCRRHHIRRLSLFGSVVREDFGPDSDVDVLVEFEPGKTPGWDFFRIEEELSRLLGRRVDLLTVRSLSPHLRDRVQSEVEEVYAAGA